MNLRNTLLIGGLALLAGCASLRDIASATETETDYNTRKTEDTRQVQVVKEEFDKIYKQFQSGELVYFIPKDNNGSNVFVNYETWKPEDNYYPPPWVMENGKTGSCKGFAILLADRLMKRDISNVFIALGKTDLSNGHAWVEFHSRYYGEFMMWVTRGDMTEKSQVTNKYFQYHDEIDADQMKQLVKFRKRPGCENFRFSYDLPKRKLKPFGVLPQERKRRGLP
jgi:hypothetical protein